MTIEEKAEIIRLMLTGIVISEYALISLKDNTKQDLKSKVNVAINACRGVQKWFTHHESSRPETAALFKKEFNSNEIVLLTRILELCSCVKEEGLETIISALEKSIS